MLGLWGEEPQRYSLSKTVHAGLDECRSLKETHLGKERKIHDVIIRIILVRVGSKVSQSVLNSALVGHRCSYR